MFIIESKEIFNILKKKKTLKEAGVKFYVVIFYDLTICC